MAPDLRIIIYLALPISNIEPLTEEIPTFGPSLNQGLLGGGMEKISSSPACP